MFTLYHLVRRVVWTSGVVMYFITIPGSFFHELAHQLACYLVGHRVLEVRYIVLNDPVVAGYVIHQGPPGAARHLLIGIAPLLMGLGVWCGALALGWYFLRDGDLALWQGVVLLLAAWITANATYHALPSPVDMEGVFRQPFSITTIPCYLIAGPVWVLAQNYRWHIWGWTLWRIFVVVGTAYVIYLMVNQDGAGLVERAGVRDYLTAPPDFAARIRGAVQTAGALIAELVEAIANAAR